MGESTAAHHTELWMRPSRWQGRPDGHLQAAAEAKRQEELARKAERAALEEEELEGETSKAAVSTLPRQKRIKFSPHSARAGLPRAMPWC